MAGRKADRGAMRQAGRPIGWETEKQGDGVAGRRSGRETERHGGRSVAGRSGGWQAGSNGEREAGGDGRQGHRWHVGRQQGRNEREGV